MDSIEYKHVQVDSEDDLVEIKSSDSINKMDSIELNVEECLL